ncbi:DNA polymerase III subunit gamma/tau, partial [Lysobacter sp. D1-1-M9]
KVYLIDEVHMLSKAAFNALLKTLEEPPGHVKFLLATTDPEKLPVTVLSRCLQFNLKRLDEQQIGGQIERILEAEAIEVEPGAVRELSKAADGSLRDGLSLLDQAIAYTGGQLTESAVAGMLGSVDRSRVGA